MWGHSQCRSNSCETSFQKKKKKTCICIKKGMWDCLTKWTDSCNFLNGLNGWFKMQREGDLPAIFLAISIFSYFFFSELQPPENGGV